MNNEREVRQILHAHRYGALCTLSKKFDGYPFGSITPYLLNHDGSLLILISTLAEHTKNIQHDNRASLITHDQNSPEIQTQGRATVMGQARLVAEQEQVAKRYLRYFPEAQSYLQMHDFSFYQIDPMAIRYIGGFGKIHWVNMAHYAPPQCEIYRQQEDHLLDLLNQQQHPTLLPLLQHRYGTTATEARIIGVDCDGLDARCGDQVCRLNFAHPLSEPSQALQALDQLLNQPQP
jgi:putative heme iron utilization protein